LRSEQFDLIGDVAVTCFTQTADPRGSLLTTPNASSCCSQIPRVSQQQPDDGETVLESLPSSSTRIRALRPHQPPTVLLTGLPSQRGSSPRPLHAPPTHPPTNQPTLEAPETLPPKAPLVLPPHSPAQRTPMPIAPMHARTHPLQARSPPPSHANAGHRGHRHAFSSPNARRQAPSPMAIRAPAMGKSATRAPWHAPPVLSLKFGRPAAPLPIACSLARPRFAARHPRQQNLAGVAEGVSRRRHRPADRFACFPGQRSTTEQEGGPPAGS